MHRVWPFDVTKLLRNPQDKLAQGDQPQDDERL